MIACFCLIDDLLSLLLQGQRLRQRGFVPFLSESEAITMEIVGTSLGFSQDKALFDSFRRHWSHFFPALASVHRTTWVRQASNLWAMKEQMPVPDPG